MSKEKQASTYALGWGEMHDYEGVPVAAFAREIEKAFLAGYEACRAEILGDVTKPDVYVPYHSEHGWQFSAYASSQEVAEMALTDSLKANGWQMVPVRIVKLELQK